jgi:phenylacetate-coenzyme A ligase PaaK-like adenylate-forming protein
MGRADETTKVRGMFVHPHQVTELLKRFPEVTRGRIVVSGEPGEDSMTLEVEAVGGAELAARLQNAIKDVMKLRGEVRIVPYGFIAPGAKIIEDHRKYD